MSKTQPQSYLRSNSTNKINLSWVNFIDLIYKLVSQIKQDNIRINYVYGVPRGGLIPATILSHELNIPIIQNFMDCKDGVVLIVDDIVDTGRTVIDLISMGSHMKLKVATIYRHKKCKVNPDYFVEENEDWIIFPYEKD